MFYGRNYYLNNFICIYFGIIERIKYQILTESNETISLFLEGEWGRRLNFD